MYKWPILGDKSHYSLSIMHLKESNEINQRSGKPDIWEKIRRVGAVYPKKEQSVEDMITIFKCVDSCKKDGRKIRFLCLQWMGKRTKGFKLQQGRSRSYGREKEKKKEQGRVKHWNRFPGEFLTQESRQHVRLVSTETGKVNCAGNMALMTSPGAFPARFSCEPHKSSLYWRGVECLANWMSKQLKWV